MEKFIPGEEPTYVTMEDTDDILFKHLVPADGDADSQYFIELIDRIEDGVIIVSNPFTERNFTVAKEGNEYKIIIELIASNSRKYYEGIVELSLFHYALKTVAEGEPGMEVHEDHDEPANYCTSIQMELPFTEEMLNNSVKGTCEYIEKVSEALYLKAARKAIAEQITLLEELEDSIV